MHDRRGGGIQWPYSGNKLDDSASLAGSITTACSKQRTAARLLPTQWAPFPEQPNSEFPLILNTGRTVEHWHTRTKTGTISILQRMSPRAWLEMNPQGRRQLNLKPMIASK